MKTIHYILIIIAFANGFITSKAIDSFNTLKIQKRIFGVILYSIFGILLMFLAAIAGVFSKIGTWFMELLQLRFWYGYHTGYYENLTDTVLENVNLKAKMYIGDKKNKKLKMKLSDWHYIYCLKLIRTKYNKQDWTWLDNKTNFIQ